MKIKKVLFIGAHTDDEIICAGTLFKLRRMGAEISLLTFSNSSTQKDPLGEGQARKTLIREYIKSTKLLGVKRFQLFNFGCDKIPQAQDEIRQIIYDYVNEFRPNLAFVLSPNDDHQAHQVVGRESERVMKGRVDVILRCQYPWNYRSFNPNVFVTLTPYDFRVKMDVIDCYKSQAFRYKYKKLFEHFTKGDGLSVKRDLAEKFELVRFVL